jgi:phosphatidylglycerophosphatase A
MNQMLFWIAQGFGAGRVPKAPGTFGSLIGLGWFALLLWPGSVWLFIIGLLGMLALAVVASGVAEKILGQKDPSIVVLDEIAAMPACFIVPLFFETVALGHLPSPDWFFISQAGWLLVPGFLAFRLFDIWKPWPVRMSQNLAGGWGVVVDDLLAAAYTNAVLFVLMVIQAQ